MRTSLVVVTAVLAAAPASAEPPATLHQQVQADIGLAVIGLGYEVPVAAHVAVMAEAHIFGTYFLPWFDRGDDSKGLGGELRVTWFARPCGRGLYVLGYGRLDSVTITRDEREADGTGMSVGAAVGWTFRLSSRVDLRLGVGLQYIYTTARTEGIELGASTPFPTIDGVLGYRL
jgi:hypothetical protein